MADPFATPTRYGRRSIGYAACALVLMIGMSLAFGIAQDHGPMVWKNMTSTAFLVAFLAIVPILHLVGLILGVRGLLATDDSKPLSIVGILLNIGLFAAGCFILWLLLSKLAGFPD